MESICYNSSMDSWFPFFPPVCGLLFSLTGAFLASASIIAARLDKLDAAAEPSADVARRLRGRSPLARCIDRLAGPFWFIAGSLTLWFSEFRAPWIMPAVGLFWMLVGASAMLHRRGRQETVEDAMPAASTADERRRLRRQQLGTGVLLLCLGIPMLWFSDIDFGAAPVARPQAAEGDSRLAVIVRQQVEPDFRRHGHVGLVVGVIAGGEEVLLGFGSRRLGDSSPPDADTPFEIGSITKVFTGIVLAKRIENGALELDDRVADLLPEGWSLSPAARGITLRHCTTHASGLPRLPENLIGFSAAIRSLFGGDPYRSYGEQAFREALATTEVEFEPGTRCLYSNFAVGLLGFVLASQSRTDYETLVTDEICRPLGMHDTVIAGDRSRLEPMSTGYRATLGLGPIMIALGSSEWRLPNHLAGAGGIRSTGRDMLTFLKANMGLLPTPLDRSIQRSHQELFRAEMRIGMNWIHSSNSGLPRRVIWHNGGTGGFRSYLGFTDDRELGVFVLANTSGGVDTLAVDILKALDQAYPRGGGSR